MIETSLYNFNTERAVNKVMPLLGHKEVLSAFFWTVKESEDRPMHTSAAFVQKKKTLHTKKKIMELKVMCQSSQETFNVLSM